ncbi:DUF3558 domain-containing protein [Nocardia arizonensis]|uniref:DUF3558 domain-containing protein n=1 Tax=Nocardia arizonensis TaxID=1141647 RepID=UPI0009ECE08A|nr:DUF3558 domain-containing protein [Nocardia arizonensis]
MVAVLVGMVAVSGCDTVSDGAATPSPITDKSAATAALWDPCTQISAATLERLGVDPSTRDNNIGELDRVDGWKLCSWKDKPLRSNYSLGVWSTIRTVADTRKDSYNIDFIEVTVSGRTGLQYRRADDRDNRICYIAFSSGGHEVDVSVYKSTLSTDTRNPCTIAAAAAEILVPIIPQ